MTIQNRQPLSAVMIACNEERVIARCLQSLSWCDEIVVIDGGSTDRTQSICEAVDQPWAHRVRFIKKQWAGFRTQRNLALSEAQHDWVFVVDADEACSVELKEKLISLLGKPESQRHLAYKVRRQEYFLGKPIHYGVWNPSYQDRFFCRTGVEYVNEIHEYPKFSCVPELIHEPLLHDPEFNSHRFFEKMNKYTEIEAREMVARGAKTNALRLLFALPSMFYKNYFYYSAYRDGYAGFVISIMEGVSRVVRHVKIWQYSQKRQK